SPSLSLSPTHAHAHIYTQPLSLSLSLSVSLSLSLLHRHTHKHTCTHSPRRAAEQQSRHGCLDQSRGLRAVCLLLMGGFRRQVLEQGMNSEKNRKRVKTQRKTEETGVL